MGKLAVPSCVGCHRKPTEVKLRKRRNVYICEKCDGICIKCKKKAMSDGELLCAGCKKQVDESLNSPDDLSLCVQGDMSDHARHAPVSPVTGKPYGREDVAMGFGEYRDSLTDGGDDDDAE